ncbi:hypothetical protein [Gilvimarinus polysaccharolyticus]|uniref:hypothetical protein n=1 Tax=Gilvimarinus polysaccharolyticus TaxID=863921 RepID=UPI0006731B14|nr:hypothetical protein [Gilvimarinus polysaccharolyticus]
MIQPASFFSTIAPLKAYNSEPASFANARPNLSLANNGLQPLERINRAPQTKPDNLDQNPEDQTKTAQNALDFIDTILTNGEFLPVTSTPLEPASSDNPSSKNHNFNGQTSNAAVTAISLNTQNMANVRAAAHAWQQNLPERINTDALPDAITSYLKVQTGDTPALGLSLFA